MSCPAEDRLVEPARSLEIFKKVCVASLHQGGLVESRLNTNLKDERKVLALKVPRLDPRVGQAGEQEVPEVERQLGDDGKDANHVDEKPTI